MKRPDARRIGPVSLSSQLLLIEVYWILVIMHPAVERPVPRACIHPVLTLERLSVLDVGSVL